MTAVEEKRRGPMTKQNASHPQVFEQHDFVSILQACLKTQYVCHALKRLSRTTPYPWISFFLFGIELSILRVSRMIFNTRRGAENTLPAHQESFTFIPRAYAYSNHTVVDISS